MLQNQTRERIIIRLIEKQTLGQIEDALKSRIPRRSQQNEQGNCKNPKNPSGLAYGSMRTMTSDGEGKKGGSGGKRLVWRLIFRYTFLDDAPDKARRRREDLALFGMHSPATLLHH